MTGGLWDGDEITLIVVNKTPVRLTSAGIFDGPHGRGPVLMQLGDVRPYETVTKTIHFRRDLGPVWFYADRDGREVSGCVACLLTDNGPFECKVTVDSDHTLLDSLAASKGSWHGELKPDD